MGVIYSSVGGGKNISLAKIRSSATGQFGGELAPVRRACSNCVRAEVPREWDSVMEEKARWEPARCYWSALPLASLPALSPPPQAVREQRAASQSLLWDSAVPRFCLVVVASPGNSSWDLVPERGLGVEWSLATDILSSVPSAPHCGP